jgi:hypothetical protein
VGGFYCIVEVTIMLVRGFLVGSLWVFLGFLCGLAGLLLCLLPVYLGAPYTFFNDIILLIKKKSM